jgi:hypothetical protein
MRTCTYGIGLVLLFFLIGAADVTAPPTILNELDEYTLFHQRRISREHALEPFDMRMPPCWDGNMSSVRIKVVYMDVLAPGGTGAYYLPQDNSYTMGLKGDEIGEGKTFIRVEIKNPETINMVYIDFVFRVKRGVACE